MSEEQPIALASDGATSTFQFAEGQKPNVEFDAFVPDEYKDKEWVRNISRAENPRVEIFKQYENAQKLIGQKSTGLTVPGEGATEAEISNFHKALGVPDDVKAYEIKPPVWGEEDKALGDLLVNSRPPEFLDGIKAAAKSAGVNPKQLQALSEAYDSLYLKHNKTALSDMAKTEAELNADFETKVKTHFGARADKVLDTGKKLLAANVPDNLKPAVASLDNNALLILSAALDGISAKYVKEDGALSGSVAPVVASLADVQAEGRRLMALPAYHNPLHAEHISTVAAVKANYAKLSTVKQ